MTGAGFAVIHVVPRIGARLDGVGDYAFHLAGAMGRLDGIACTFVDASALADRSIDFLEAALHAARSSACAARATALVHYVNYGYSPRGCPFWLVDGLERWKSGSASDTRLLSMFHEVYAFGPPWRSSFWLSPLQRHLARRLARASDVTVTNRRASGRWLGRRGLPPPVVMPVFSTLGEPHVAPSWAQRLPRMVVAGRSGERGRAYDRWSARLVQACRALGIEEIVDIGQRAQPPPAALDGIAITALGHVEPAQASAVMARARAGFLDYPSDFLAKSTVFAAYAAHGLVPVVSWPRGAEESGLANGGNYWVPGHSTAPPDFEAIARRAREWYSGHALDVQARRFAQLASGPP
jgi:hypothetical protein